MQTMKPGLAKAGRRAPSLDRFPPGSWAGPGPSRLPDTHRLCGPRAMLSHHLAAPHARGTGQERSLDRR